jgi:hypothetical protein
MPAADDAANGLSQIAGADVGQPMISSAEPGPRKGSAVTKPSAAGETESLLDINGLLEIARLIEKVREDGRLKREGEERPKPSGSQHQPRPKQ